MGFALEAAIPSLWPYFHPLYSAFSKFITRSSGLSYTELEYNYALEHKKPLFAVVASDECLDSKARAGGMNVIERVNTEKLNAFKDRVKCNLIEHYDDPKDIKAAVHTAIASLVSKRDLKGWVRADEIIDNSPLLAELKKMSDELTVIKNNTLQRDEFLSPINKLDDLNFEEMFQILHRIVLPFPYKIAGYEGIKTLSLREYFTNFAVSFVNGIVNDSSSTVFEDSLFETVCPRLYVHGLLTIETIGAGKFRRYNLAEKGRLFLAECEKQRLNDSKV